MYVNKDYFESILSDAMVTGIKCHTLSNGITLVVEHQGLDRCVVSLSKASSAKRRKSTNFVSKGEIVSALNEVYGETCAFNTILSVPREDRADYFKAQSELSALFSVNKPKLVYSLINLRKSQKELEETQIEDVAKGFIMSPVPREAAVNEGGFYILMGRGSVGKSRALRNLVRNDEKGDFVYVLADEPHQNSISFDAVGSRIESILQMRDGAAAGIQRTPLILLDSIKELVLSSEGQALKGGISSSLIRFLTKADITCRRNNISIVAVVNPVVDVDGEKNVEKDLFEAFVSSCSGCLWLHHDGSLVTSYRNFNSILDEYRIKERLTVEDLPSLLINLSGNKFSPDGPAGTNPVSEDFDVDVSNMYFPKKKQLL